MIYKTFIERTKGIELSELEEKKILFEIVKDIPGVQVLAKDTSFAFHKVNAETGRNSVFQVTQEGNNYHIVINLGIGSGEGYYNQYGSKRFKELFQQY